MAVCELYTQVKTQLDLTRFLSTNVGINKFVNNTAHNANIN